MSDELKAGDMLFAFSNAPYNSSCWKRSDIFEVHEDKRGVFINCHNKTDNDPHYLTSPTEWKKFFNRRTAETKVATDKPKNMSVQDLISFLQHLTPSMQQFTLLDSDSIPINRVVIDVKQQTIRLLGFDG